jgi:hypothetical protein
MLVGAETILVVRTLRRQTRAGCPAAIKYRVPGNLPRSFNCSKSLIRRDYDGRQVLLHIDSGSAVGAVPLVSPISGRRDFGLVVQPRFPWKGIGPMLAEMGWLISPTPLRLPLLKRSERRVPPWVLSFMILARLKAAAKTFF